MAVLPIAKHLKKDLSATMFLPYSLVILPLNAILAMWLICLSSPYKNLSPKINSTYTSETHSRKSPLGKKWISTVSLLKPLISGFRDLTLESQATSSTSQLPSSSNLNSSASYDSERRTSLLTNCTRKHLKPDCSSPQSFHLKITSLSCWKSCTLLMHQAECPNLTSTRSRSTTKPWPSPSTPKSVRDPSSPRAPLLWCSHHLSLSKPTTTKSSSFTTKVTTKRWARSKDCQWWLGSVVCCWWWSDWCLFVWMAGTASRCWWQWRLLLLCSWHTFHCWELVRSIHYFWAWLKD